jgi:hypothetical protein
MGMGMGCGIHPGCAWKWARDIVRSEPCRRIISRMTAFSAFSLFQQPAETPLGRPIKFGPRSHDSENGRLDCI